MWLEELSIGDEVFIDANIFLYDILGLEKWVDSCKDFLKRIENCELQGYTSPVVLGEVLHKLIISEAIEKFGIDPKSVIIYLKNNPDQVKKLKKYKKIIKKVNALPLEILYLSKSTFIKSSEFIATATAQTPNTYIMPMKNKLLNYALFVTENIEKEISRTGYIYTATKRVIKELRKGRLKRIKLSYMEKAEKSLSSSTIQEGQTATVTLTIKNNGVAEAKDLKITDSIPSDFKLISGANSKTYASLKPREYRFRISDFGFRISDL